MSYWAEWDHLKGSKYKITEFGGQPSLQHTENDNDVDVHSVCKDVANNKNLSHYVRIGEANPYIHNGATPKYMDTFEKPYAVFVFRYASDGQLQF